MQYSFEVGVIDEVSKTFKSINSSIDKATESVRNVNSGLDKVPGITNKSALAANKAAKQTRGWMREVVSLNRTIRQVTALVGAGFGIQSIASFTGEAIRAEQAVSNAFGVTGSELQSITQDVKELSGVFGGSVEDTVGSAQSLVSSFGLTTEEALTTMRRGLELGVPADTINGIAELSEKFDGTGIAAEEFFAKMIQGSRLGVSEQLESGLSEASKVLADLGKNSDAQQALAALGFNPKEIDKALKEGTSTISDVVKQVSDEITYGVGVDSAKAASAMASIFGASGEGMKTAIQVLADGPSAIGQIEDRTTSAMKAQQRLYSAWNDIKNLFTDTVVPAFASVVDWVYENQEAVKTWGIRILAVGAAIAGVWAIAKTIAGIKAIVTTITVAWSTLSTVISAVRNSQLLLNIAMLANPIGLVVAAIAGIGVALWGVVSYWDEISGFLIGVAETLWKFNPLSWMVEAIEYIFPGFKDSLSAWFGHVKEFFGKAFDFIGSYFIDPIRGFVDWFGGWWDWFSGEAAPEMASAGSASVNRAGAELPKDLSSFMFPEADKRAEMPSFRSDSPEFFGKSEKAAKKSSLGVSQAIGNVAGDSKQAKNITINIESLIGNLTFAKTTMNESKEQIKESVLDALTAALRDANNIA